MAAASYQHSDQFTTQLSQASQGLSEIFKTGHALKPPVEIELKRAAGELLEHANSQLEHIKRYQELTQQYINSRIAFDQAIDRRALSPEVKAAAKGVLPSMPNNAPISNSFILAHIKDAQRKGQALLRVLLVAEKGE